MGAMNSMIAMGTGMVAAGKELTANHVRAGMGVRAPAS